jgi:hypothetical protein
MIGRLAERVAERVHPHRHDLDGVVPQRLTEERPFFETRGMLCGLEVGVTVSELHQVRAKEGLEVIHVVAPDGSSNLETVLARQPLGLGQRIELQGPALNTSLTPGTLPVGARFVGVGLTSDLVDEASKEAVSYTFEVKLTERSVAELAVLGGAGAAAKAADLLEAMGAQEGVQQVVAECFAGAVPVISALIALASARWALKLLRDPEASRLQRSFAVAHAISDALRVVFPLAGTLGNAALVFVSTGVGLAEARRATRARAGPAPSAGVALAPPPAET